MIIFCVNDEELPMNETSTILDLKQEIIKKYKLSTKYIDLVFLMDKPSRILGKFNVEPGKVARPFDRHTLDKFAFKDKIQLEYSLVDNYDPSIKIPMIVRKKTSTYSLDRPLSSFDHTLQEQTIETTYDLQSMNDFPSLG
tara:strand:- start:920 stop:1339 length:420 start_codon:yes stop_codon:yes gene_type:complete